MRQHKSLIFSAILAFSITCLFPARANAAQSPCKAIAHRTPLLPACIDTGVALPSVKWLSQCPHTGKGIWICINECVDINHLDFCEIDSSKTPPDTIVRKAFPKMSWGHASRHGTKVASVAAGNGWRSTEKGGAPFEWRGVAPKALVHGCFACETGDVNNHSTHHRDYYYDHASASHDRRLHNHNGTGRTDNNIGVFAVGNYGIEPLDIHHGYFSLINCNKNGIKVGTAEKGRFLKSDLSSIGPARDGRVGIDIMAPAAALHEKWDVKISSIAIVNKGRTKYKWNFASYKKIATPWPHEHYRIHNPRTCPGGLCFSTEFEGYLFLPPVAESSTVVSDTCDTLILKWRTRKTLGPPADSNWIYLYWRRRSDRYLKYDNPYEFLAFTIPESDTWQTSRIGLADRTLFHNIYGWQNGDTLSALRLDFRGSGDRAMRAAEHTNNKNLPVGYVGDKGSSLAAPYVCGVVALMLQKYNDTVLKHRAGKNIHDHPFWNSTARAILIHTATDMIDTIGCSGRNNPEYVASGNPMPTVYGPGPDWATGYGMVNPLKALRYVDTLLFREDSIQSAGTKKFVVSVPRTAKQLRVTLVWDDPPCGYTGSRHATDKKLVNDLNLAAVSPREKRFLPWVLAHSIISSSAIPHDGIDSCFAGKKRMRGIDPALILNNPARQDIDSLNNVEVVDVINPKPGKWRITVSATSLTATQDFSLVADYEISNP
jgi:hypothetical protein